MPGEGQPPFGWRRYRAQVTGNDLLIRHPDEWPALQLLVRLVEDGWTHSRVANMLNLNRFRNRWGRPWTRQRVGAVYRNRRIG